MVIWENNFGFKENFDDRINEVVFEKQLYLNNTWSDTEAQMDGWING